MMKRFGLPKVCLLKNNGEFNRVYRQGCRLHGQGFSLIFAENRLKFNRLGISVQKKTGNAVHRNRIKRMIREIFRLHRGEFPLNSDVVLTVRPGFSYGAPADLLLAVTGLMQKQGRVG